MGAGAAAGVPAGRYISGEFWGWVFWLALWGAGIAGSFFVGAIIALMFAEQVLGEEGLASDILTGIILYAGGALGVGLLFYLIW